MKYKELKDPCKTLLEKELCLGCNQLSDPGFETDINCNYAKKIIQPGATQISIDMEE